ncbi:unnamed protein product [Porites lobata]|uniref:Uncharacterized protein n=1 Tax=Porites lobata TaxID=104759 RepID=A0ABN8QD97_9CNID|nr:unnamed protein product [Porites lobata]
MFKTCRVLRFRQESFASINLIMLKKKDQMFRIIQFIVSALDSFIHPFAETLFTGSLNILFECYFCSTGSLLDERDAGVNLSSLSRNYTKNHKVLISRPAYPQELFARVTANLSSEHKIVSAEDCYNNEWMAGFLFCCGLNVVLTANMTQLLMYNKTCPKMKVNFAKPTLHTLFIEKILASYLVSSVLVISQVFER